MGMVQELKPLIILCAFIFLVPTPILSSSMFGEERAYGPFMAQALVESEFDDSPGADNSELRRTDQLYRQSRLLYERGDYSGALPLAEEVVAVREKHLGMSDKTVAPGLVLLGLILHEQIDLEKAKIVLARSANIYESKMGPKTLELADSLTHLGRVLYADGDFEGSEKALRRALSIHQEPFISNPSALAITLTQMGSLEVRRGQLLEGRIYLEKALDRSKNLRELNPDDHAELLEAYGFTLVSLGEFERARQYAEQALVVREQAQGRSHPHYTRSLIGLAMLLFRMGDVEGGRVIAERALHLQAQASHTPPSMVAASLTILGRIHLQNGEVNKADPFFREALRLNTQQLGPNHFLVAENLVDLGHVQHQRGSLSEARSYFEQALTIQEGRLGEESPSVASTRSNLAWVLAQQRDYQKAQPLFQSVYDVRKAALGPRHPDVAASLTNLARLHHEQGDLVTARPLYEEARHTQLGFQQVNSGLDDVALERIWVRGKGSLHDYALLLGTMSRDSRWGAMQTTAIADGFLVAEQARGWTVQAALARSIARSQSGGPREVLLMREVDELRRLRQSLWNELNGSYGQPVKYRDQTILNQLKNNLQQVQQKLDEKTKKLETMFPRYAELAVPEPIDVQTVTSLLEPQEALLSFFALKNRLQIWLLKAHKTPLYYEVNVEKPQLVELVNRLRMSLLPVWDGSTNQLRLPPFDVGTASTLYDLLLKPIEPQLGEVRSLILIPDQVLLPLPFAALITEREGPGFKPLRDLYAKRQTPPPESLSDYAQLSWLAKSYPLTILPSASALKLFRQTRPDAIETVVTFIGFGDPVLNGTGHERGGDMMTSREGRISKDAIQALNQLPGTRAELMALATALQVDPGTHLYLGERAHELQVKQLNNTGQLGTAKVLAFATHGLLAGELKGLTQPALVLTPPEVPFRRG